MMLVIGNDNEVEEIIEESKFSELGIWERTHMEEWIAKYPQILGEDLLTITTEYSKFDKTKNRLDILAIDTNGKLVIIELKRDVADKFVDLQAIHYASYCSNLKLEEVVKLMADHQKKPTEEIENQIKKFITDEEFTDFDSQPRIFLVANDFKEETLSAVLWLIDYDLDITCIKLEPYKIEDKIVINPQIIIPLPEVKDYMMQIVNKKKTSTKFSLRDQEYKKFWDNLVNEYRKIDPNIKVKNPYPQAWLWYGAGKTGLFYSWIFSENQFTLELYINNPNAKLSDHIFNKLSEHKDEIEKQIGELLWYNPKSNKIRKIRMINGIKADIMDLDKDETEDLINWGLKWMPKFKSTFEPLIKSI